MKFMLLCYTDERQWQRQSDAVRQEALHQALNLAHELNGKGQYIVASRLQPVATATSVRVRDGKPLVTDGPFAETREVLGGFYLVDAKDREEALEIAARHPGARFGGVEVRPVMEIPGLPVEGR